MSDLSHATVGNGKLSPASTTEFQTTTTTSIAFTSDTPHAVLVFGVQLSRAVLIGLLPRFACMRGPIEEIIAKLNACNNLQSWLYDLIGSTALGKGYDFLVAPDQKSCIVYHVATGLFSTDPFTMGKLRVSEYALEKAQHFDNIQGLLDWISATFGLQVARDSVTWTLATILVK